MPKPLIIAFLFFSRLPMPTITDIKPEDNGRALLYLPVVGAAIGLLLYIAAQLLNPHLPTGVTAAIILTLWCMITGGLHLDGLADSADAWLAGGDAERSLEIMKDPRCGAAAIIAVACLLFIKFSALSALLEGQYLWALILVPILGRASTILLFLTTPYARNQGLSQDFNEHAPRCSLRLVLIITAVVSTLILGLANAFVITAVCAALFYTLRRLMMKRLGGTTGDTSGAFIEIIEAGTLIALVSS